jgi:cytochrome P450
MTPAAPTLAIDLASDRLCAPDPSYVDWLRTAVGPVLRCARPTGFLVLSAEGAVEVLTHPDLYSSVAMAGADAQLLGADGDRHRRTRRMLVRSVKTAGGPQLAAELSTTAAALLDDFAAAGGGDAVSHVARPLAQYAAARASGLPVATVRSLAGWADGAVRAATGRGSAPTLPVQQHSHQATAVVRAALAESAAPAGTLLDDVSRAVRDTDLSLDGAVEVLMLVLLGALDTTTALVAGCLAELASRNTDLDPAAVTGAVLRRRAPVRFVRRTALARHRLAGIDVPEGSTVVVHLRSASAELAATAAGHTATAAAADHLAFGAGPHACPGARLARLVARTAVTASDRVGTLATAGSPIAGDSAQIDSYSRLPLSLHPHPEHRTGRSNHE